MGEIIERRWALTKPRLSTIQNYLKKAAEIAKDKACVYATGSFGRGEASQFSDLDAFIVGRMLPSDNGTPEPALRHLDEIRVKAELVNATLALGIPEFSGDGEFLRHYTIKELVENLGTSKDDSDNTFTARLLLLLESQPLIGTEVYDEAIATVIDAYWQDFEDHQQNFVPAFLSNDILRLWRTFCVNYEANTRRGPAEKKPKRKLKNYKLKHSRLLTCYSAIIYLLATVKNSKTVTKDDVREMVKLRPTERLTALLDDERHGSAHNAIDKLIRCYERFLETSNFNEKELIQQFRDEGSSRRLLMEANEFGDLTFEVLKEVGEDEHFFRLLMV